MTINTLTTVDNLVLIQDIARTRAQAGDPIREISVAWLTIKLLVKKVEKFGQLMECDEDRLDNAIGQIARGEE